MTPEAALNLLNEAVAQLPAPRNTHVQLQQAINIIGEALKPKPVESNPEL